MVYTCLSWVWLVGLCYGGQHNFFSVISNSHFMVDEPMDDVEDSSEYTYLWKIYGVIVIFRRFILYLDLNRCLKKKPISCIFYLWAAEDVKHLHIHCPSTMEEEPWTVPKVLVGVPFQSISLWSWRHGYLSTQDRENFHGVCHWSLWLEQNNGNFFLIFDR